MESKESAPAYPTIAYHLRDVNDSTICLNDQSIVDKPHPHPHPFLIRTRVLYATKTLEAQIAASHGRLGSQRAALVSLSSSETRQADSEDKGPRTIEKVELDNQDRIGAPMSMSRNLVRTVRKDKRKPATDSPNDTDSFILLSGTFLDPIASVANREV